MNPYDKTPEEWQKEVERLQRELDWTALMLVQSRENPK
jgi:hypothetical protein